jgi:hypothetical protein|tara:strand:- start:245 stop:505 length:261 start_codon:yes stop_codon:yes gene_type:complete
MSLGGQLKMTSPQLPPLPQWGKNDKVTKVRAQVKSRFYYLFWGIATASVVLGQLYVGSGYRGFARSLNRIFDTVEVEVGREYNRYY